MNHRTWLDIDLDALTANYRTACGLTESVVTAVVKANAYGHGLRRTAQALWEAGCRSFAVSQGREALALRQAGITGELLVMGWSAPEEMPGLIRAEAVITVSSAAELLALEAAAVAANAVATVQLKVDTGFHRLGFEVSEEAARQIVETLRACPHVRAIGLFSHLGLISTARDTAQHELLLRMRELLSSLGLLLHDVHICDSIGLVRYPAWHHSRVRVGAFLYGVRPARSDHLPFPDLETIALRTTVTRVHEAGAGEVIGYDESGATQRPVRVATLCAGYGDGYPRCLSGGRGQVLIRGQRAPVIGLVCMDQMMVDVTGIPDCAVGDTATLLGGGIPYGEFADWAHTNRNECLTILSARPIRVYHQGGRVVTVTDDLLGIREDEPV